MNGCGNYFKGRLKENNHFELLRVLAFTTSTFLTRIMVKSIFSIWEEWVSQNNVLHNLNGGKPD